MPRSLITVDGFAKEAKELRAVYDARFANPRDTHKDRFVWDYWHVPGQYTLLRTPAYHYFPPRLYEAFHSRLVWWGRRTLGCHDVSPPWLSCYVAGCAQELHGDLPHGQWAFVYSLTPWSRRRFSGGETLLLRDDVLDFWRDFTSHRGLEEEDLVQSVAPRFNRLVVFDPRIPHGVRRVDGTLDPREGRLVIHGWFVQPRPFIEGPVSVGELSDRIGELTLSMEAAMNDLAIAGLISISLAVAADGRVREAKLLCDTTRAPPEGERRRRALLRQIMTTARAWRFQRRKGPSRITLPLVFER